MKKTQLISTLLLIAMLAGCGTTESGNEETTSSGSDTTEETTADTSVKDDLPADLDFTGKELRILTNKVTSASRRAPPCKRASWNYLSFLSPPPLHI